MVSCCHCQGLEQQFDRKTAERELRRYRRSGPTRSTRLLVEGLLREGVADASLLDIGGGVGAVQHRLLEAGATSAVHVDVSASYIEAAREEATRRGDAGRVRFVHGDFVQLAPELGGADIVTLDRVICCYPDMEALVGSAADKARRLLGAVYPREAWWTRVGFALANLVQRLRRCSFRPFLHPPAAIDGALRSHGFGRRSLRRTSIWEIVVYARADRA